jgi:hypothetical protein
MMEVLKLSLEDVLIVLLFADCSRGGKVNGSNLEGCRIDGCDEKVLFVARLRSDSDAMVFSKLQNEWCLSRAYIKSSYHAAEMAAGSSIDELKE